MSFFRNLRSSITRGRSSSRDTTPVRSSRPGSVISGISSNKRRDSIESATDSIFNRSGTFILDDPNDNAGMHSNTSTLEKKSKKSKVLEKFSTFTKRKKTPASDSSVALDHHPSDNATNTYYKWQSEGSNSLDYDSQADPFNFLYEQNSLKSLHNGTSSAATANNEGMRVAAPLSNSCNNTSFDSSTYRKGKMPTELKKQLEHLKHSQNFPEHEDSADGEEDYFKRSGYENDNESDKYKTVTLNSFRKSFREKFLQQQKEAPHNPAWFVEVETPAESSNARDQRERSVSKENRNDFLVFENDNYRPGSRSPVRDSYSRRTARAITRSPVKRNDTFKVERSNTPTNYSKKTEEATPSIRIEFRNSITPHIPGRMVPVGVAKPMPCQNATSYYDHRPADAAMSTSYTIKTSRTRLNGPDTPEKNINKPASRSPARPTATSANQSTTTTGRYQTLVQIKNDTNTIKLQQQPVPFARPSRLSTRIQLGGTSPIPNAVTSSPSFAKRYVSSHATNVAHRPQPLKQTYFGDSNQQHYSTATSTSNSSPLTSSRLVQSPSYAVTSRTFGQKATSTPVYHSKYQNSQPQTQTSASRIISTQSQSRSTPSYSASSGGGGSGIPSYHKHQQQSRYVVPVQRRSRSPIKIPWR
uniref:Uncharacterized protein n=1 Tax=Stomoxys calcitrans TaxID=35570 RepID=A0A1I8NP47_STOCA